VIYSGYYAYTLFLSLFDGQKSDTTEFDSCAIRHELKSEWTRD